jgi:hypothetical protein
LGKPVTKQDFFVRPYKIKVFLTNKKIFDENISLKEGLYQTVSRNMALYLERHFRGVEGEGEINRSEIRYHAHTPFPMIKWIAGVTEDRFPHVFKMCSSHRFRSVEDLSITNGLIPQYALRLDVGEEARVDYMTLSFKGKMDQDSLKFNAVLERKPMFFCVQDGSDRTNEDAEACLKQFLETYYPDPAPWEKPVCK